MRINTLYEFLSIRLFLRTTVHSAPLHRIERTPTIPNKARRSGGLSVILLNVSLIPVILKLGKSAAIFLYNCKIVNTSL